jgi:hypothetical protein
MTETRLTTTSTVSRLTPAPLSPALDRDLSIALNAEWQGRITARAQLPAASRLALADRCEALGGYSAPARPEEILSALVRVFMSLASKSDDGVDAQTRAMVYTDILAGLPPFAVINACGDFCLGRAGDRKWVPTAPELRAVAERYAAPLRAERQRIERALAAKVDGEPTRNSKEANLAHARETIRQLGAALPWNEMGRVQPGADKKPAGDARSQAQKAREWLEEQARASDPTPKLSPALRAALGLPEPREGGAEDAA